MDQHGSHKRDEGWVEAYTTNDEVEAVIVRDLLLSAGIDVRGESMRVSQYPLAVGSIGELVLYVREHDLDEAVDLINEFEKGGTEEPDGQ